MDASSSTAEPEPKPISPSSYLHPETMATIPLSKWTKFIRGTRDPSHRRDIDAWAVTSIRHMKSFHFSAVMHEYLEVHIEERTPLAESDRAGPAEVIMQVERMLDTDYITAGWKWVQHPELASLWITRLIRGYFGDSAHATLLSSASQLSDWKAINFSGSDILCVLKFPAGIPLCDFADVLDKCSTSAPMYSAVTTNCFWFAFTVYESLKKDWGGEEHRSQYCHLRGKFAGLSVLSLNFVSAPLSLNHLGSDFEHRHSLDVTVTTG